MFILEFQNSESWIILYTQKMRLIFYVNFASFVIFLIDEYNLFFYLKQIIFKIVVCNARGILFLTECKIQHVVKATASWALDILENMNMLYYTYILVAMLLNCENKIANNLQNKKNDYSLYIIPFTNVYAKKYIIVLAKSCNILLITLLIFKYLLFMLIGKSFQEYKYFNI